MSASASKPCATCGHGKFNVAGIPQRAGGALSRLTYHAWMPGYDVQPCDCGCRTYVAPKEASA